MGIKKPIHIFGHMNPDTDSVCSAISYAYLKNKIDPENEYIPSALGKINDETTYVLKFFGMEEPKIITHLKPQVSDIDLKEVYSIHEMDSIKQFLEVLTYQPGRTIPVVDDNNRLIGVASITDLVPMLLSPYNRLNLNDFKIPLKNLIETLDLSIIFGEIHDEYIRGRIHLYNDVTHEEAITMHDIVLCSLHEFLNNPILRLGAGYVIIGDIDDINIINIKENTSSVVMTTPKNLYDLVQNVIHAFPISSIVKKDQLEYFTTYETIDDVKKNMLTSKYRRFPVVNEQGVVKGMISRSNLIDVDQKKAILVDHNERGQSIEGIEQITIMEVIDHHRVADIQTMSPLYFRVEPVGSTCTLVAKMYEENNITIPKKIAGLLLSGILSDTLVFKSPTCTKEDRSIAEKLEKIARVNIFQYGMKMITKGERLQDQKPEQIITTDMKRFTFGQYKVVISQINTGDFEGLYQLYPDIVKTMEGICENEGMDLAVLMVTNIIIGGTEVIAVGEARWIAENAFNIEKGDISIFLNDTFSRKKQIVPKLMKAAQL